MLIVAYGRPDTIRTTILSVIALSSGVVTLDSDRSISARFERRPDPLVGCLLSFLLLLPGIVYMLTWSATHTLNIELLPLGGGWYQLRTFASGSLAEGAARELRTTYLDHTAQYRALMQSLGTPV